MICDDLSRAGLGRPDEHFNTWVDSETLDWRAAFEELRRASASPNGIRATKIMANQLRAVDDRFSRIVAPAPDAAPFPFLRAAFQDATWIWVRRRDAIAQAVSMFLAKRSGVFHSVKLPYEHAEFTPGASVLADMADDDIPDVEFDFPAIYREWQFIRHSDQVWSEFFALAGLTPLVWVYEDYTVDLVSDLAAKWGVVADMTRPRNLVKLPAGRSAAMRDRFARLLLDAEFDPYLAYTADEIARAMYAAAPTSGVLFDSYDETGLEAITRQISWEDLPRSTGSMMREDLTRRAAALLDFMRSR